MTIMTVTRKIKIWSVHAGLICHLKRLDFKFDFNPCAPLTVLY